MADLPALTDETFEAEVLQSDRPVLVDFGAEWCHPCKQLDPIIEALAQEWNGAVKVFAIDADDNTETTMRYGVMGLPTLILFKDGEPRERLQGFQPKKRILKAFGPHLGL